MHQYSQKVARLLLTQNSLRSFQKMLRLTQIQ